MNEKLNQEELKKFAAEIDAKYPEFGGVEDSMRGLAEQLSEREEMFCSNLDIFKNDSANSVEPSRQRFKAVACKRHKRRGNR